FIGESRLLHDRSKGSTLQVAIVKRHSHAKHRICRMPQDVVTSGRVMNKEPRLLECSKQTFRSNGWKSCLHDSLMPRNSSSLPVLKRKGPPFRSGYGKRLRKGGRLRLQA